MLISQSAHIELSALITDLIGQGFADDEIAQTLGSLDALERLGYLVTREDVIVATLSYGFDEVPEQVVTFATAAALGYGPSMVELVEIFRRKCIP